LNESGVSVRLLPLNITVSLHVLKWESYGRLHRDKYFPIVKN
jgi:hypothetical protein